MPVKTSSAPWTRLRLRQSPHLRDLCSETTFTTAHLIQPIFIVEGMSGAEAIPGLDGNERLGVGPALETIARDIDQGVRHVLLFAVPEIKGTGPFFAAKAVDAIKKRFGTSLCLWVDVCLCSTTPDGHCAIFDPAGRIDLDRTLDALGEMATVVAGAGADGVSPSDMMDGRVAAIRSQLDELGHTSLPIMAYSAKYASAFYGPFREAAESTPAVGDRRGYQMDPANAEEAVRRVNASSYGLGGAVFGRQNAVALARQMRSGMVSVNGVLTFAGFPSLPFGGVGDSGFGRIHGDDGLREMSRPKAITRRRMRSPLPTTSFTRKPWQTRMLERVIRLVNR